MNNFSDNFSWQMDFYPQISEILKSNAMKIVAVSIANQEDDRKRATDFTIKITGGNIAVRVRRDDCKFRDWTIRSRMDTGYKTELAKLKEGCADYYLYCWTEGMAIKNYILVEMKTAIEKGLLEKQRKEISNKDGTHFIAIGLDEIRNCGAMVVEL